MRLRVDGGMARRPGRGHWRGSQESFAGWSACWGLVRDLLPGLCVVLFSAGQAFGVRAFGYRSVQAHEVEVSGQFRSENGLHFRCEGRVKAEETVFGGGLAAVTPERFGVFGDADGFE